MSRIYESRDLTKGQADESAQSARDDIPPALDVQEIQQPDGKWTVIATYADVGAATSEAGSDGQTGGPKPPAHAPASAAPAPAAGGGPTIGPAGSGNGANAGAVGGQVAPPPPQNLAAAPAAGGALQLTSVMLSKHWPRATQALRSGIVQTAPAVFAKYQIDTPLRLAHFMAQISEECGAGTEMVENMNYTHAQRIMAVWPSRFPTYDSASPYVGQPRLLGDKVYNGRMGNRIGTDDGYNFRGRGCLQLTGRSSYADIGTKCGLDLVGNPDLVSDPADALAVASAEFVGNGCLPWCDHDNVVNVSALVNLGHLVADERQIVGLTDRKAWLKVWKAELGVH
ncbi:glycoside hydrolase family 19 protein [Bradyrhizobium sp. USDA 4520]